MVITLDRLLTHIETLYSYNETIVDDNEIINEADILKALGGYNDLAALDGIDADFIESVVRAIDNNFLELDLKDKKTYLLVVKEKEREQYENIYKEKKYRNKFGILKIDLLNCIKEWIDTDLHIMYMSDFFGLNIFIMDKTSKIKVYYSEDLFNKFKSSVILYKKSDNVYNIVESESKTVFSYHDKIVKSIVRKENFENLVTVGFKKLREFDIGIENLDFYLKRYCIIDTDKFKELEKESREYINNNLISNKETKQQLDNEIVSDIVKSEEENAFDENTSDEDSDKEFEKESDKEFQKVDDKNITNSINNLKDIESVFMKQDKKSLHVDTPDKKEIKVSTNLKKNVLVDLAKKLKIDIKKGNKDKTKQELCNDINSKI